MKTNLLYLIGGVVIGLLLNHFICTGDVIVTPPVEFTETTKPSNPDTVFVTEYKYLTKVQVKEITKFIEKINTEYVVRDSVVYSTTKDTVIVSNTLETNVYRDTTENEYYALESELTCFGVLLDKRINVVIKKPFATNVESLDKKSKHYSFTTGLIYTKGKKIPILPIVGFGYKGFNLMYSGNAIIATKQFNF